MRLPIYQHHPLRAFAFPSTGFPAWESPFLSSQRAGFLIGTTKSSQKVTTLGCHHWYRRMAVTIARAGMLCTKLPLLALDSWFFPENLCTFEECSFCLSY